MAEKRDGAGFIDAEQMPWQDPGHVPRLLSQAEAAEQIYFLSAVDPLAGQSQSAFVDAQRRQQNLGQSVHESEKAESDSIGLRERVLPMAPYLEFACSLLDVDVDISDINVLRSFAKCLPVTGIWSGLLGAAHQTQSNRNWEKKQSDQVDFFNLAVGASLFDIVLVDAPTKRLASELPDGLINARLETQLEALLD